MSLREKLFVGCDTNDFGSNGGLVDNAFSFANKTSTCTEGSYKHTILLVAHVKIRLLVEISQSGVTRHTDVSKECKQAQMEALSKQPVIIVIEADHFCYRSKTNRAAERDEFEGELTEREPSKNPWTDRSQIRAAQAFLVRVPLLDRSKAIITEPTCPIVLSFCLGLSFAGVFQWYCRDFW